MRTYVHTYIHTHACIRTYVHAYVPACMHVYICVCIYIIHINTYFTQRSMYCVYVYRHIIDHRSVYMYNISGPKHTSMRIHMYIIIDVYASYERTTPALELLRRRCM